MFFTPQKNLKGDIKSVLRQNDIIKGNKVIEFIKIFEQYAPICLSQIEHGQIIIPFNIGQTIVSLLTSKEKVFNKDLRYVDNKTSEVLLYLNPSYEHKMNISIMNSTHLPMLVPPKQPENTGYNYLPYYSGEISHVMNTFDRLVKDNYKNKHATENLNALVKTMVSLNNVSFKINKLAYNIFKDE
jgi:hypothetical protein